MTRPRRMNCRDVVDVTGTYYGSYTVRVTVTDSEKGKVVLHLPPYMAAHLVHAVKTGMASALDDLKREAASIGVAP